MPGENEIVVVELSPEGRLRLYGQITAAMEKAGYNPCDYDSLKLGFELPAGWPVDKDAEVTLAQITVLAVKLGLRIMIGDLNVIPLRESDESGG